MSTKHFLATAVLLCLNLLSVGQSLQFLESGTAIAAQSSYSLTVIDSLGDQITLDCINLSAVAKSVVVKRTVLSTPDGCSNDLYFCDAVFCYPPNVSMSVNPFSIPAGAAIRPCLVADMGAGTCCGNYQVNYTVYDINNPADSAGVLLNYHVVGNLCTNEVYQVDPVSFLGNAFPNPAVKKFFVHYKTDHQKNQSIQFFSATGEKISSYAIDSSAGSIEIDGSGLSSGIYYYALMAGEQKRFVKRIVIIH